MKCHRYLLAAGLAPLLAAAAAPAGPLDKSKVAADAKWVVHLDAQAAKESTLGRFVLDNPGCAELRVHMAEAQEELGFDPVKVLLDATAYGAGGEETAVIVIHATKDIDGALAKLKEMGKEEEGGYREIKLDGCPVHSWKEGGSTTYAYFAPAPRGKPDERFVLISGNQDALRQGIDVLGGKAQSLASGEGGGGDGGIKASPSRGSVLFGAAIDIPKWAAGIAHSEVVKKAESLRVDAGELDGKLYADIDLAAHNEQDATNVSQMLQGAVAMVRMMAPKEHPQLAPALDLASGLTFTGKGNTINIKFSCDSAKMLGLVKMAIEEDGKDHKAHHKSERKHEKEKDGD